MPSRNNNISKGFRVLPDARLQGNDRLARKLPILWFLLQSWSDGGGMFTQWFDHARCLAVQSKLDRILLQCEKRFVLVFLPKFDSSFTRHARIMFLLRHSRSNWRNSRHRWWWNWSEFQFPKRRWSDPSHFCYYAHCVRLGKGLWIPWSRKLSAPGILRHRNRINRLFKSEFRNSQFLEHPCSNLCICCINPFCDYLWANGPHSELLLGWIFSFSDCLPRPILCFQIAPVTIGRQCTFLLRSYDHLFYLEVGCLGSLCD